MKNLNHMKLKFVVNVWWEETFSVFAPPPPLTPAPVCSFDRHTISLKKVFFKGWVAFAVFEGGALLPADRRFNVGVAGRCRRASGVKSMRTPATILSRIYFLCDMYRVQFLSVPVAKPLTTTISYVMLESLFFFYCSPLLHIFHY